MRVLLWFNIFIIYLILILGCVFFLCKNGVSCVEGIGYMVYVCYCKNGFIGINCE